MRLETAFKEAKRDKSSFGRLNWTRFMPSKNPARDFCYGDRSVCVCVCASVKWLVGPSSTSSTIKSVFIRLGLTGRC
jgi:hypothetical protein